MTTSSIFLSVKINLIFVYKFKGKNLENNLTTKHICVYSACLNYKLLNFYIITYKIKVNKDIE
jgi:hypothetical protein